MQIEMKPKIFWSFLDRLNGSRTQKIGNF